MTSTHAPVLSVERGRPSRGAGRLVVRAVLLLCIAALPVAFSAWVDPARFVSPRRAEQEIARALAAGHNVTNFSNYDDRAIERFLAPLRPARIDVLVLGSSRAQALPASAFPGAVFANAAMKGGVFDDAMAIYGLYDRDGRRPRRVVLNVDPWMESFGASAGWESIADEHTAVLQAAGIPVSPRRERIARVLNNLKSLAAPEYFRLSVYSFRHYGTRGIPWLVTDRAQNAEKTKLPDGTVVWTDLPADNAERVASHFAAELLKYDPRFRHLERRAPGRDGALERFVAYMRREHVEVTLMLVPFPPVVYDAFLRMPGYPVSAVERDIRTMAARVGARVVGSYDPNVVGVTTRDFFDEDHLKPEPLVRLVGR